MKFVASDKAVATKHPKLGEMSVDVEVPQCESIDEAISFIGGPDQALAFLNGQFETNAKNGGRALLRGAPDNSDIEKLKEKVKDVVRGYTPRAGGDREPGKAKKAAAFDNIKALVESGKEFTKEELLAMLESAK